MRWVSGYGFEFSAKIKTQIHSFFDDDGGDRDVMTVAGGVCKWLQDFYYIEISVFDI